MEDRLMIGYDDNSKHGDMPMLVVMRAVCDEIYVLKVLKQEEALRVYETLTDFSKNL